MQHFIKNFIQVDYGYAPVFNEPEGTYGRICIERKGKDPFTEHFYMCEKTWSIADYVAQWNYAWDYFKKNKATHFVVNIQKHNLFVETWALYKLGNTIRIRNYLFSERHAEPIVNNASLSPKESFFFLKKRRIVGKREKYRPSEWIVHPTKEERILLNM